MCGEPSPRAAASVGSASESTFDGKASVGSASESTFDGKAEAKLATFNRTYDGKAEASTATANKASIGLTANLARASMSNLNAGKKSQRGQGSQRSSARGALEHATDSATCAHDGGERNPLTSKNRAVLGASTIGSTAARLPSTSQPVGVIVHEAAS